MRIRLALLSATFAACVGLPASAALGQVIADQTLPAGDATPFFFDSGVLGCGKGCAAHVDHLIGDRPNGWQPGQLLPGARFGVRGPGADPTDVLNNNLSIEISPPNAAISGSNLMTIRSNVSGLTTFTFRLRSQYAVSLCRVTDSVGSYNVTPTTPGSSSYGRVITFTRPIALNETFTIQIDYNGNMVGGIGLGNLYIGPQNGTGGNPSVICTLSEPYYAATWWPCKDGDVLQPGDNSDKATLDMAITAPDAFTSLSNGMLAGVDTLSGGRKRYRWTTGYPMSTYLVFFSTSVYNQWSVNYNHGTPSAPLNMPVEFSIYPVNDNAGNRAAWERTLQMLEAFRPIFGLYPFVNEKYGIYQFEFNGGMEHQTYSGQGRGGAFHEGITAHELAHQWWGNEVTCKTWSDIWLNEGFAVYSECLWEERKPGSTGFAALRSAILSKKPTATSINAANSYVYIPPAETSSVTRIFSTPYTYQKPAWVLHMLRRIMGETNFFNGIQAYRAAYQQSAAGTTDFIAIMQGVHGSDLSWFFNPWVYLPGAPQYTYGWQSTVINGQNYLRLNVTQSQTLPATVPLFTMPMDVRISTVAGVVDTTVRTFAASGDYLIPIPAPVIASFGSVTLDPNDWILNYGKFSGTYVQGPPKVIAASPLPGAAIALASSPSALTIGFSDNVNIAAGNVGVTVGATPVPFTFAYAPATLTATLTFSGPLAAGTYNVAISDTITAVANSRRLDGELASNSAAALPSGDGVALGSSVFTFTVTAPPCPANFNPADPLGVSDIFAFLTAWFAGSPSADFNQDMAITVADIFAFLTAWFAGCP